MSVLNSWQRIDRVIPGKPFGDGKDGVGTVSSDPNTRATYAGTAGSTSGTAGSTAFANGDLVRIIQTQGTNPGQNEYNMVVSGGGTTSLVMKEPNHYTYGTGAQIIKIPRYTTATVNAHDLTSWNGTVGGHEEICARISVTIAQALNGTGKGFRTTGIDTASPAYSGEGTGGVYAHTTSNRGNGGGGGGDDNNNGGSAGGGNGTAGGVAGAHVGGTAGSAISSTDGTIIWMGGGGGNGTGTNQSNGSHPGAGGYGGAIFVVATKALTVSANVTLNGNAGASGWWADDGYHEAGGAGGAGGTFVAMCVTASLGTYITATGGGGGLGHYPGVNFYSGVGGAGNIVIQHSGTVTGTTNPTFTDVTDLTLVEKESAGGIIII